MCNVINKSTSYLIHVNKKSWPFITSLYDVFVCHVIMGVPWYVLCTVFIYVHMLVGNIMSIQTNIIYVQYCCCLTFSREHGL